MLETISKLSVIKTKDDSSNTHFIPLDRIDDIVVFKEHYSQSKEDSYRIKIFFGGNHIKLGKAFKSEREAEEFLRRLFL